MRKDTRVNDPVVIDGKHQEDVEEFNNLGTKVVASSLHQSPRRGV